MAVFFDTGGGDIYAGPTKEAVIKEILQNNADLDISEIFEVPGTMKVQATDENDEPKAELTTLDEEYVEGFGAYCIASENC